MYVCKSVCFSLLMWSRALCEWTESEPPIAHDAWALPGTESHLFSTSTYFVVIKERKRVISCIVHQSVLDFLHVFHVKRGLSSLLLWTLTERRSVGPADVAVLELHTQAPEQASSVTVWPASTETKASKTLPSCPLFELQWNQTSFEQH